MRFRHIVAIVIFLGLMPSCQKIETERAVVGKPAPAFSLKDPDGKTVRLADFRGKIVVIDFWATWCAPCKESTTEFKGLHEKYKGRGVAVIGISMDEGENSPAAVRRFAKENMITYVMLMDDERTSDAYAVRTIPATYILDRDHVLVKTYPGYLPGLGEQIAKEIEGLL